MKHLKIKTKMHEMKNTFDGINGRLDIVEEKSSELELQKQKLSKMKQREKSELKMNKKIKQVSVSYGTT